MGEFDFQDDAAATREGEEEFGQADPFDGVSKRDQDVFFRVMDLLPNEQLESAMDYFMDHPQKIRDVVAYVRLQKDILASKNAAALNEFFAQERIAFTQAPASEEAFT